MLGTFASSSERKITWCLDFVSSFGDSELIFICKSLLFRKYIDDNYTKYISNTMKIYKKSLCNMFTVRPHIGRAEIVREKLSRENFWINRLDVKDCAKRN